MNKFIIGGVAFAVLLAVGGLTSCSGIEQVDTGHRGVQVRFGEVDEKMGSLSEGLYFFNPITTNLIEMDVRTQRWEGKATSYTKDVQQAQITFVATYNLDPAQAHTMFKTVGRNWAEKVVGQAVLGPLKQVIGQYDAVDLIAHRQQATVRVTDAVKAALADQHVILTNIELVDITYHSAFEKAVEDKVVAVQRAIEEKNRTEQIREQSQQQIIAAEATAKSMKIRADALASNPKLVEYEAVQKWDGKLPQYNFGGGTVPFINLNK